MSVSVGWVHELRKAVLVKVAESYRLDATGTLDELRQRVTKYCRDHQIMGPPTITLTGETSNPEMLPGTGTSLIAPEATPMERIRKWGTRYDGGAGAAEFLQRLGDLQHSYMVTPAQIIQCLSEILKGRALGWYRLRRTEWQSWDDFVTDFRAFFLTAEDENELEATIVRRVQRPGEAATDFILDLLPLMQQYGKYSPEQQVNRAYRNLRPEYRRYIKPTEFATLPELMRLAAHQDKVAAEEKEAAGSRQKEVPKNEKRPEKRAAQTSSSGLAAVQADYDRATCCWRCGQRGHRRPECRRASKLFCSYCGTAGRTSRDCPCNPFSGNEDGRGNRGDRQNAPSTMPQANE